MGDVHQDNQQKQLEAAQKQARLARTASEFFTGTPDGQELLKEMEINSGANFPAFSARDDFNERGAAYRDGMRSSFLFINDLIKQHKYNEQTKH